MVPDWFRDHVFNGKADRRKKSGEFECKILSLVKCIIVLEINYLSEKNTRV